MKMKTLLLTIVLFVSSNLFAQTDDYDPDGTYWGPDFSSVNIDFTQSSTNPSTSVFPDPIADGNIRQYDCLGLIRYTIINGPVLGQTGVSKNKLYNNNPTIDGKANNTVGGEPTIYFPRLINGAGKIRIRGWVSPVRSMFLNYYDEDAAKWVYKGAITIPSDGTNMVEYDINVSKPTRLKLMYNSTSWLSILSIEVSAYGEELSTLPLTLLGYNAELEGAVIKKHWTTTNEVNTSHFIVERSSNGTDFTSTGEIKAKNTPGQHDYYFTDQLPSHLLSASTLYYRLLQVDKDGKSSYSQIVPVKIGISNKIILSPNPAKDYIHVFAPGSKSFSIISTAGTEVFSTGLNPKQDSATIRFGNLAKGIYLVKITDIENKVTIEKILIE